MREFENNERNKQREERPRTSSASREQTRPSRDPGNVVCRDRGCPCRQCFTAVESFLRISVREDQTARDHDRATVATRVIIALKVTRMAKTLGR